MEDPFEGPYKVFWEAPFFVGFTNSQMKPFFFTAPDFFSQQKSIWRINQDHVEYSPSCSSRTSPSWSTNTACQTESHLCPRPCWSSRSHSCCGQRRLFGRAAV